MKKPDLIELAKCIRDGKASTSDFMHFLQALRFELGESSKILSETKKQEGR